MDFLPSDIEQYALNHTGEEDAVLQELTRETYAKILWPRMLSGPLQGKYLELLVRMIRPQRILEIGTFTGYSAICFAKGLPEGGHIHTIDVNDELERFTRQFWEKAGVSTQITYHLGDARTIIPTLHETWDLVFIDADKENYAHYYDLVFEAVRPGGWIVADNVLWSGKVVQPLTKSDPETEAIMAFNAKVHADNRVEHMLLPLRDGLMIAQKK